MAIGIRISLRGLQQTVSRLQALMLTGAGAGQSMTELHRRFGVQAIKWINENFQQSGGLLEDGPWQRLSENTIAGRRKGSNKILMNNGLLRQSFNFQATSTEVRVGSASKVALFHEEGTEGPYEIKPRNKKSLAFPVSARFARFAQTTTFNSGTGISRTRKRATRATRAAALRSARFGTGHIRAGQDIVHAAKVIHPGLVKRRMLPRESELMPRLIVTAENWIRGIGATGAAAPESE